MKVTHYGHACVLFEFSTDQLSTRILIDPGTYSNDFEELERLDAVLITHNHPDHLDLDRILPVLRRNPDAEVIVDPGSGVALSDKGIRHRVVAPGDSFLVGGTTIDVIGGTHAVIHHALPDLPNNGYVLDGLALHPGDAFVETTHSVEVLLLPIGGPWMKIGEAIDYLQVVRPAIVIPIHQAGLAQVHRQLHHTLLQRLAPDGTEVTLLKHGTEHAI